MDNRQISEYNMALKSKDVLMSNSKIWEGDKIFAENVAILKANIIEIDDVVILQKTPIKGVTIEKSKYRTELNDTTNIILGVICTYATKTDNPGLFQKFDIPKSSLSSMVGSRFSMLVKDVSNYIITNKLVLKPYGLTDELMKTFQSQTNNFNTFLAKPAETMALIKESTQTLKTLMKKLMNTFTNLIDKNILIYSKSQPFFYGEYMDARRIYGMPQFHNSLIGNITDLLTSMPVYYATIKVIKYKAGIETASKVKKSTKNGNYNFKGLEIGQWTVIVECTYYEPYITEINILPGIIYKLNIQLKKI